MLARSVDGTIAAQLSPRGTIDLQQLLHQPREIKN
jgi:hypothetical protein